MKIRNVLFLVAISCSAVAQQATKAPAWEDWKFLLGDWVAEQANGTPGEAAGGGSTFKIGLGGHVLLRTNRAEYPATKDHAAFLHEDLLIVYRNTAGSLRADYWDNEGHVIHYAASADGKSATFLSDQVAGQPRYRLTYRLAGESRLQTTFEIAPPGKPGEFHTYVEATVRRQ